MRDDFQLAEIMWDAADPCLTRDDRSALSFALHAGDPFLAIFAVVRAVIREGHALPRNIFDEFHQWLADQPGLRADDPLMMMRLELAVIASRMVSTAATTGPVGGYGDATLCYFVFDEAGVVDASHDRQAHILRQWLARHRPGPSLRADMYESGFGYLLRERRRTG